MTLDEAQKVADVCSNADGGCRTCVSELVSYLTADFPEFQWSLEYRDGDPKANQIGQRIMVTGGTMTAQTEDADTPPS